VFLPIVRGQLELLEELAFRFVERQAAQSVVYTEVRYSPHLLAERGCVVLNGGGHDDGHDGGSHGVAPPAAAGDARSPQLDHASWEHVDSPASQAAGQSSAAANPPAASPVLRRRRSELRMSSSMGADAEEVLLAVTAGLRRGEEC
jgi:hypothetical protein